MTFSSLLRRFDSRPDIRGRQFELLCRWYLQNAPEYRRRFTKVWLWKDWPEAWAADAGIDLVAEEHDGSLWAIQAKAYGENYAIKKADVDSFLSESSRPHFSYRLLIATTDRIGSTARRTLDGQRVPVGYLLRSQLELAQVQWPSSLDSLRPRRPKPKKPFPHVREAIRATVKGFDGTERGQLIMACGTGKTLVGLWSSEGLQSIRTLVLLPSLSLLAQTLREWTANAAQPFDYLAVCSDETVVGEDEFVASTAELGLPVTTNPTEISTFLRRRGRRVVFSTYQSSPQIAAAQRTRTPQFDLAIADEAHRCAGRVASEFARVLDADQIKSRRRLFMTATPRYYTPGVRHEAQQLDVEIASMDDESVFGPVLHRLTFGEAIQRDLLSDYQVVVVGVTDSTYHDYAERGELITRDGNTVTDARTLAGQIGLAKTMRKWDLRRVVSFHGRVKAARQFSVDMPDVIAWMPSRVRPKGTLWSEHVSGAMPSGRRDRLLLRFRNLAPKERGLLSNARCLGEGVDVPSIDGVAFIDPRHSTIDIIQALGRAIRKAPDKKVGTIVLPVFVSAEAEADQVLNESSFRHVWDVLKALRAHDDALGEELDDLRRQLGAHQKRIYRPARIHLDMPTAVRRDFARAFDVRLIEQTTTSWEFWYGLLQRYVAENGSVAGDRVRFDGFFLGKWIQHQRRAFRRGLLDRSRRERLESIPGWEWEPDEARWERGYEMLQRYVRRKGNARVPEAHVEDGFRLGSWAGVQRGLFRQNRLDSNRAKRLEAMPGWEWRLRQAKWERAFSALERYVRREGNARVPPSYRENGVALGMWVSNQRHRRRILSLKRRQRLERLPGWAWDPYEASWQEGFSHLHNYVAREGNARVPPRYQGDGFELGRWVTKQRGVYRRGALDTSRAQQLTALPGWAWDPRSENWENGYSRLVEYVKREGHARVPLSHREDSFRLGQWVTSQRTRCKDQSRIKRLEQLPGWVWDTDAASWEEGYARLMQYVAREGDARVPRSHQEGDFNLGRWADKQRGSFRRGVLDPTRRERLEAVPGWIWKTENPWSGRFALLRQYVEREGHSRIPYRHIEDGFRLDIWVTTQRKLFKTGHLDRKRAEQLESLPGWIWDRAEAAWENAFARLVEYVEREGHADVPVSFEADGVRLGQWVQHQRQFHRHGRLAPTRTKRLEALPEWTWTATQRRRHSLSAGV
jgi:superfamily II DNA or RNA helicase